MRNRSLQNLTALEGILTVSQNYRWYIVVITLMFGKVEFLRAVFN